MRKSCLKYPVECVDDVFGESPKLAELLKDVTGEANPRVLLVADMNVVQHTEGLGTKIGRYVQTHGITLAGSPVVILGGEKIKADGGASALRVAAAALEARIGKSSCVMAMGGGTLLDIVGYAAAQVRGGVPLVRLPTTPAAMIDAAYANYAALDGQHVKDALRVMSEPTAVVVDVLFAQTVLDGVWRSGMGEALRLAAAFDSAFAKQIAGVIEAFRVRNLDALRTLVSAAIELRPKKGGTDLAIWLAHRLETMSGYKLPHGYAIPIALAIELDYSVARGFLEPEKAAFLRGILTQCGALDGLAHSHYLLDQVESVLSGLDDYQLITGRATIPTVIGLGKSSEEVPDRAVYEKVLRATGMTHENLSAAVGTVPGCAS